MSTRYHRTPEGRWAPLAWVTAVVAALFGVLYSIVPPYADDLWYLMGANESLHDPWQATLLTIKETVRHLDFDTGRLANLLSPPWLCLLPKWVFGVATGALIFLTLRFAYEIVGGSRDGMRRYVLLGLYVVVLPWFDYMLVVVFALNYVWSSCLAVVVAWYFLSQGRERASAGSVALFALLSFLLGWMHEGASVPMAAGLAAYILFRGERPTLRDIIPFLALVGGIALLISFPAIWQRSANNTLKLFNKPASETLLTVVAFNCMFYVYCLMLLVAWAKRKLASRREKATAIFFLTFGLASTAIFVAFYGGQRVGWFNQLFCAIGTLWLAGVLGARGGKRWVSVSLKMAISLLLVVHLAAAINAQRRLSAEFYEVEALVKSSPDGTVYYDIEKPRLDLSLYKTSIRGLNERMPLEELENFYYYDGRRLRILPTDLQGYHPDASTGLSVYRRKYVILVGEAPAGANSIGIKSGGKWLESRYRSVLLDVTAAGDSVYWIVPHLQTMLPDLTVEAARW